MTNLATCGRCGAAMPETAPSCPECGAASGPAATTPSPQAEPGALPMPLADGRIADAAPKVSAGWQRKFALIERAGGPRLPKIRDLPFWDRSRVMFNFFAYLLGPIYYLAKGMWLRAITLTVLVFGVLFILNLLFDAMQWPSNALNFAGGALFAVRANVDYYRKVRLKDNGWW